MVFVLWGWVGHFGAKNRRFITNSSEIITCNDYYFKSPITPVCPKGLFKRFNIPKDYKECCKMSLV
jgi:hypothetical protein